MRIEVIKTETESKGKYSQCIVSYRGPDGKVEQKKLMSFGPASTAFKTLKDASPNDVFEIKSEQVHNDKDGKDYWYWTEAVVTGKVEAGKSTSTGTTVSPRSTYETPEERARKQVYIVRQSSITAALGLLNLQDADASIKDVIDYAKQFEDYVFNLSDHYGEIDEFDLPNIKVK